MYITAQGRHGLVGSVRSDSRQRFGAMTGEKMNGEYDRHVTLRTLVVCVSLYTARWCDNVNPMQCCSAVSTVDTDITSSAGTAAITYRRMCTRQES